MALRTEQFDSLMQPMIYHHLGIGQGKVAMLRDRLFNVQKSSLKEEKGTGLGGISPDSWDVYKNSKGAKKGRLDFNELYTQTYTHQEYPLEIVVQKSLFQFDQYNKIKTIVQRAGLSAGVKKELDAASLLNNAFASGSTWSDDKPLCSASHPVNPDDTTNVYSNTGTSPLTAANLSSVRQSMMRFKDDTGVEIGIMPNELWVPVELEDKALELTQALNKPETANNDANAQAQRWTVIPWLRLDSASPKRWFMVDGMWRQEAVNWYDVVDMEIMLVHENTTEVVWEVKLFYSFGVDDWRWIYGNNPA